MADARAMNQAAEIVNAESGRRYVVVSAPGKRSKDDVKVTDLLYECAALAAGGKSIRSTFSKIRERFLGIAKDLKLEIDLSPYLNEVEETILNTAGNKDYAASRGEYLTAILFAAKLGYAFVDAAEMIKFNENGNFDSEYTNDLVSKKLQGIQKAVIPGFYGSMPFEGIKTFSRGGSDITGSIVARGVGADIYENWTDVNGFLSADPRIVKNPLPIDTISYRELRELSYMGASVLHADAIFPVRYASIPINIRNTFCPEDQGTMIVPQDEHAGKRLITGIAGKKDYTILYIEKSMMNAEIGFGRKVLSVLERYGVMFEHMPSGIDTLSLVVSSGEVAGEKLNKVVEKIRESVAPDDIAVVPDIALIATVGHGMSKKVGTAAKLCGAIAKAGVNLRMIDQGSSELNIIIAVKNEDYEKSVQAIYDEFLG